MRLGGKTEERRGRQGARGGYTDGERDRDGGDSHGRVWRRRWGAEESEELPGL